MSGPFLALLLTFVVHVIGALVLVWAMAGREAIGFLRTSTDDGGGTPPEPAGPERPREPRDGLPLPDAAPARVRLREPARLGEAYPRPARRPEPVPAPERAPGPAPR